MKKTLLASAAALLFCATTSFASVPADIQSPGVKAAATDIMQAGRSKPRVPGGSGCDTARDRAEHPECRVAGRSKPRVPGGSGCDTAQDRAEHPECRRAGAVNLFDTLPALVKGSNTDEARRGRGRRARVPGGSGCDSAHDIAEHPECRRVGAVELFDTLPVLLKGTVNDEARRRARVPGGSGCNSPRDRAEHPECRV